MSFAAALQGRGILKQAVFRILKTRPRRAFRCLRKNGLFSEKGQVLCEKKTKNTRYYRPRLKQIILKS
jgi:hypothetical protein